MLDSNLNRLFLITLQGLLAEGPQIRVSAKRTLRLKQTRFLAISNDFYVHYKG